MCFRAVVGIAACVSFPALASEGHLPHGHTHSRGEIDESHAPLLLQATYTGEVMSNVSGGIKRGSRYLDNLDIVAEADLEAIAGWKGASAHVYGLYNNGKSFSDLAGDAQTASNIETGVQAFRLYEAWIEQKFAGGSLKVGLYDLNSEFDALDASPPVCSSAARMASARISPRPEKTALRSSPRRRSPRALPLSRPQAGWCAPPCSTAFPAIPIDRNARP